MTTNNAVSRPQIRRRSRTFCSLFGAVTGALLLTAALVPRANADCDTLLVYFNFEDPTRTIPLDLTSDQTVAAAGDNPGGGIQMSTLTINYGPSPTAQGDFSSTSSVIPIGTTNRSAGDTDTTANQALLLNSSSKHNNGYIQFAVDATYFQNMSLSYAVNTNGNGFKTQTLWYSTTGPLGTFTQAQQFTGLTGQQTLTYTVPALANLQTGLVLRIVFTDGQSNGNDLQTIIDNIQLTGCVIPEPATVVGGLLSFCGLCWLQRRRLICFVRLRGA